MNIRAMEDLSLVERLVSLEGNQLKRWETLLRYQLTIALKSFVFIG